ncbi:hypothetical protein CPC08DRAFT_771072 [Agrocybe pediades]|nr:hypothetical protein CPC08DRAFT_771072 [Agrocybe pediades]
MPRSKWTSPEQHAWLKSRFPEFLLDNQERMAAKKFFPNVTKEFRELWPVEELTEAEIAKAGSVESAKQQKDKIYDKKIRNWFHNQCRSLNGSTRPRDILDLKIKKPKTRKLQLWQAYQALTKDKWVAEVETGWTEHKQQAATEGKKPPKKMIFLMNFFRLKLEKEPPEMLERCNKYIEIKAAEATAGQEGSAANQQYQEGIDKLPDTLKAITTSLMEKTGWNITIIAGGPCPRDSGMITISNAGVNKSGQDFEAYLGDKKWDGTIQVPFEKFLHSTFSAADCASRSLQIAQSKDEECDEDGKGEDDDEKDDDDGEKDDDDGEKDDDDGEKDDNDACNDGGKDDDDSDEDEEDNNTHKPGKISEYEARRNRNIAQLQEALANIKVTYPIPDDVLPKKPASKKKKTKKPNVHSKGKHLTVQSITSRQPSHTPPIIPPPVANEAPQSPTEATSSLPAPSLPPPVLVSEIDLTAQQPPPAPPSTSNVQPDVSPTTPAPTPALGSEHCVAPRKTIAHSLILSHITNSIPLPLATPASPRAAPADNQPAVSDHHQETSAIDDHDDSDVPVWLQATLNHLREASQSSLWQALVTALVQFENSNTVTGKLPTTHCPKEVADWIKSKNKTMIPSINSTKFGEGFITWWVALQPAWRTDGSMPSLPLKRDVPPEETWVTLRKGGTAGIYVVVMALSWWVRSQVGDESGEDVWVAVDDLKWVLEQMGITGSPNGILIGKKRHREDEEANADSPPKLSLPKS